MTPSRDAALFAGWLTEQLLVASGPHEPAVRRQAMAEAFQLWPKLCRRMSALETLAPNEADEGYRYDEALATLIRDKAA